eukprot:scaffold4223_cov189-Amphora_coffeaeformis.AAC.63
MILAGTMTMPKQTFVLGSLDYLVGVAQSGYPNSIPPIIIVVVVMDKNNICTLKEKETPVKQPLH